MAIKTKQTIWRFVKALIIYAILVGGIVGGTWLIKELTQMVLIQVMMLIMLVALLGKVAWNIAGVEWR